jgi:hypothetical protein
MTAHPATGFQVASVHSIVVSAIVISEPNGIRQIWQEVVKPFDATAD